MARTRLARLGGLAAVLLAGVAFLAACDREPEEKAEPEPAPAPESALPTPERVRLAAASFAELPGWEKDDPARALPALRRSCDRLLRGPGTRAIGPKGYGGTVAEWKPACTALGGLRDGAPAERVRRVLKTHFAAFSVADADGPEGLFTGYYEATLRAAETRRGPYRHPLYAPPGDLIKVNLGEFDEALNGTRVVGRVEGQRLVPYHGREAIAEGALDGHGRVLLWADDPVDIFFLHIQGSGVAELPDGRTQRIGYAASNGREFTPIGRELIESGELDGQGMSMQAIRDWLRAHPDKAEELMNRNARYIFFRRIEGAGPIGAFGVPLTAGRSLAVDPSAIPLGAPLWLDTTYPASDEPLRRLMVAQDTGSAIKGTVRGDFFWGHGEDALAEAGRMKQTGRYWLLLPKSVVDRLGAAS